MTNSKLPNVVVRGMPALGGGNRIDLYLVVHPDSDDFVYLNHARISSILEMKTGEVMKFDKKNYETGEILKQRSAVRRDNLVAILCNKKPLEVFDVTALEEYAYLIRDVASNRGPDIVDRDDESGREDIMISQSAFDGHASMKTPSHQQPPQPAAQNAPAHSGGLQRANK